MSKPIILWRRQATLASDDACTAIYKYTLAPPSVRPPYQPATTADLSPPSLSYVPSLAYFCIQKLVEHTDQLHFVGSTRLLYEPPQSREAYDILRAVIPSYRPDEPLDLSRVDPRLWSVLIQLYSNLPGALCAYTLPLSDPHLPLLQRIPCTPDFALLTVLELPGCQELSDDTIVELKALHGLCAFDASGTKLTAHGVRTLAKTLVFGEGEVEVGGVLRRPRRGPWGLRILSLRNCPNIKNEIFECLPLFPLLSVVDLRGAWCTPGHLSSFKPSAEAALYHPMPLSAALAHLQKLRPPSTLFSHPEPFILRVKGLNYKQPDVRIPTHHSFAERTENRRTSVYFRPSDDPSLLVGGPSRHRLQERAEENPRYHPDGAQDTHLSATHQQNAVATTEALLHAERQSALRFYNNRRRLPRSVSDLPDDDDLAEQRPPKKRSRISLDDSIPPKPASNPLMLFRHPPSWSSLPSAPDDGGLHKRPRALQVMLRTDQARESARGKTSLSSMVGMVLKRAHAPASSGSETVSAREDRPVSKNPFARIQTAAESTTAGSSAGSSGPSAPAGEATALAKPRPWATDATPVSTLKPDKDTDPNRPLRPITTLKIPQLPPSIIAAARTSMEDARAEDAKGKKAVVRGTQTQTRLPALGRSMSMRSLKAVPKNSGDRHAGKGRRSTDAKTPRKSFDWKGWAGG